MSLENQHIGYPSLEEIMAASKPGVSAEQRAAIRSRLAGYKPADDTMAGAVKFLEDHNYDFDALYEFLEEPIIFSMAKKKSANILNVKNLSIAATIFILISISTWFYLNRDTPNTIMAKAIFHEPGLPVFASVQGNREFHELMSSYKMEDAKTGLGYYYTLINKEPMNDTLNYFGGWLYYINHQPDSAAISFEKVTVVKSELYQSKAQFMQAISLYMSGNKKESKLLFENIVQDKIHPYRENALQLLAFKRLW